MIVSCDELDGAPENIPIIFEENYVDSYQLNNSTGHLSSSSSSSSFTSEKINNSNNSLTTSSARTNILKRSIRNNYNSKNLFRRNSTENPNNEIAKDDRSTASESNSVNSQPNLTASNKQLHKKLKKKTGHSGDLLDQSSSNKAITLVSYKKVNDYFNDQVCIVKSSEPQTIASRSSFKTQANSNSYYSSSSSSTPTTTNDYSSNIQSKLSIIKADLAARSSLSSSSSNSSSLSNPNTNLNFPNKGNIVLLIYIIITFLRLRLPAFSVHLLKMFPIFK